MVGEPGSVLFSQVCRIENPRPIEVLNSFSKGTSSSNAYPQMGGASEWDFTLALSFKRLQVMEEAWDCEYSQASLVKSTWLPNS